MQLNGKFVAQTKFPWCWLWRAVGCLQFVAMWL